MTIKEYLKKLNTHYKSGIAREHTYRPDLQNLIESLVPQIRATNEPRRIECGAPDYVLTHNEVPVGYIEAKDIEVDLKSKQNKEQFMRYRNALENLIITDYLIFEFYKDGKFVTSIQIGEVKNKEVVAIESNFDTFTQLIHDFCFYQGQTIRSAKTLAELMAGKARLLARALNEALDSDNKNKVQSDLVTQYNAFKQVLIDSITLHEFADVYAQTVAYGMFAARLHDTTLDTFSREEAATLIPHSNPFLRKMFQYMVGFDADKRVVWIVDALADVFKHTDVSSILKNFGKSTAQHDPMIHFYETFLAEYDPKLRKSRGVWYTPQPVVSFIVRAVDEILQNEFRIADGLANRETIQVERNIDQTKDARTKEGMKKEMRTYPKVQILDPATGTGTFLAEVIKQVHTRFENNQGMWNGYVRQHLVSRLNGFEILMASYAMAHLKMDLLLEQTGYKPTDDQRFNIFLTNSLEESHSQMRDLFTSVLSIEANAANRVKRDTPVMCVIGNPPYSGISQNDGKWITDLIGDYKKEPNTTKPLQERKHWLNDDYVKFIRYAQHYVEKNGSGVVAYINPHGFLDNPTFRGMRWNLLKTFDKIYTIDLHGNAKKKETAPDGSVDENVFDIMQGVSINLFVKTGAKHPNELGKVYHHDLWGKRESKYEYLSSNSLSTVPFVELENRSPMYFMTQKDFGGEEKYNKGFSISNLFPINSVGIVTARDHFAIDSDKNALEQRISDFANLKINDSEIITSYKLKDTSSFNLRKSREVLSLTDNIDKSFTSINYRPFDTRHIFYNGNIVERTLLKVMRHFIEGENVGLVTPKINREDNCFFISKNIIGHKVCSAYDSNSVFPLYLYPDPDKPVDVFSDGKRKPNLNETIVSQISKKLKLVFVNEEGDPVDLPKGYEGTFAPIHLLDYIYAVLHSPSYRDTYKEFLKTDFPRVPYPTDRHVFWQLVALGKQIRQLHLMETTASGGVAYPIEGTDEVSRGTTQKDFELTDPHQQTGRVWINDTQYFDRVPRLAWEFFIGGYQPAQKWLKDRKDRTLSFEDIEHYQHIIHALSQTSRLMQEVDTIRFF